jgi:hypothetical protein
MRVILAIPSESLECLPDRQVPALYIQSLKASCEAVPYGGTDDIDFKQHLLALGKYEMIPNPILKG